MTNATKASLLLGTLLALALGSGAWGVYQSRGKAAALQRAAIAEGESHAAAQAETAAKADKAAAQRMVQQQAARLAQLEHQLQQHPHPAPAVPVPADAPASVVVAGLQSLGIHPNLLGDGLALTTPDGRIVLGWGREALRVPALEARMGDLESLTAAQRDQAAALETRQAATDRALAAADARAYASERQAQALQRAIDLTPRWRPNAVGLIGALDFQGQRHLGVTVSRSFGPVEVGALYLNRNAGVMAVIRF